MDRALLCSALSEGISLLLAVSLVLGRCCPKGWLGLPWLLGTRMFGDSRLASRALVRSRGLVLTPEGEMPGPEHAEVGPTDKV